MVNFTFTVKSWSILTVLGVSVDPAHCTTELLNFTEDRIVGGSVGCWLLRG